jgi:uncharacterized membrane protein HdeD (DUF308 family)
MRRLSMMFGAASVLSGVFLTFMAYGFASMVDPDLPEAAQQAEIMRRILEDGTGPVGSGIVMIVVGIYLAVSKPKPSA